MSSISHQSNLSSAYQSLYRSSSAVFFTKVASWLSIKLEVKFGKELEYKLDEEPAIRAAICHGLQKVFAKSYRDCTSCNGRTICHRLHKSFAWGLKNVQTDREEQSATNSEKFCVGVQEALHELPIKGDLPQTPEKLCVVYELLSGINLPWIPGNFCAGVRGASHWTKLLMASGKKCGAFRKNSD